MEDIEHLAPEVPTISAQGVPPPGRRAIHRSKSIPGDGPEIAAMGRGRPDPRFEPADVRYIKLGENGKWAASALEQGIIPFGYRSADHRACLAGSWENVRHQLVEMGRTAGASAQGLRELNGEPGGVV